MFDEKEYNMQLQDVLYVGRGTKEVLFRSKDPNNPAEFYFNSSPAHHTYPTVKLDFKESKGR